MARDKSSDSDKQAFWIILALVIAVLLFGGFLSKEQVAVEAGDNGQCPAPQCATHEKGCVYLDSDKRNAEGCLLYPCSQKLCDKKAVQAWCKDDDDGGEPGPGDGDGGEPGPGGSGNGF